MRAGRWRPVRRGVYATFSGPLSRSTQIWAALLYAGDGATLSHETAAEMWGFADQPSTLIHVSVPRHRRVVDQPGLRIHLAGWLERSRHPVRTPPVTRVEETVLDLADVADSMSEVVLWVTRACQRRRSTPARLLQALQARKKARWRVVIRSMLADVTEGAESALEIAYVRQVERAHGLPVGVRQRHRLSGSRSQWTDVDYMPYGVIVELDGRIGHVEDGAFRDHRRDNASTVRGHDTLRYGWVDTVERKCAIASEVASVLRRRGWTGLLRPCGPGCGLAEAA